MLEAVGIFGRPDCCEHQAVPTSFDTVQRGVGRFLAAGSKRAADATAAVVEVDSETVASPLERCHEPILP